MFAERLKALRKGRNLTLRQLAKGLNQNFDYQHPNTSAQVENWERGIRIPSYVEIMKLARYFHVSMDYLAGRSYNDHCDLANLLISNKQLTFNHQPLNARDRNEIYAILQGYLFSKNRSATHSSHHQTNRHNQQQSLKLNLKS